VTVTSAVVPLASYRNETPYPFCPGCGHAPVLDLLNEALVKLQLDPRQVVLVSDIGCSGLSDQYFRTSAFHGLHGRSITYASGIKLARPDLTVIVIMGDGGCGIGGAHLLSAARRNIGLTLLVLNNFNFGMTGGQHSTTTPTGAVTSTTPGGNLERPLDICATVAANGAGYVYRGTNFDRDLSDRIAEAVRHDGFSVLDVWDLCTAYYVPRNKLSKKALLQMLADLGFATGVLHRHDAPEYTAAYTEAFADAQTSEAPAPEVIEPGFAATLNRRYRIVVAGSAVVRIGSATRLVARAAILSGSWAAQRNDYPITIKTGHSVSELILSSDEIHYAGITRPDALVILSAAGLDKSRRYLTAMEAGDRVFVLPAFADVSTRASVTVIDPSQLTERIPKANVALAVMSAVVHEVGILRDEAVDAAARQVGGERPEEMERAVEAGRLLSAG
jgi:pyruvate/2-oxoacid:ferredoxin oxidoreductase beta subunit